MATIFRDPVITQRVIKDSLGARQFVSAGLALLTAVALPVGQAVGRTDLPKAPRDPRDARQFTSPGLALRTAVALPVGKSTGFGNLPVLGRDPKEARYWVLNNDLPPLVATYPFAQRDWPLPKRKDSPLARDRQRINDLSRQLETHPFSQLDWPLPDRIDNPLARERTWVNPLSLTAIPFTQYDWPLPDRIDSPLARDRQRVNDLSRQTATYPFAQLDWPLPDRVDSPLARDRQRINDLGRQLEVRLPTQTTEWPLAKRRGIGAPENLYVNQRSLQAQPFAQLDWDLPAIARLSLQTPQPPNTAILTPVVVVTAPFAQFGWDIPRSIDSRIARDWIPVEPIPPEPTPPASTGPNALRRLLQTEQARAQREADRAVLQGMFSPDTVQTKQQQIQALEKAQNEAILSEDDDDILPFLGH